ISSSTSSPTAERTGSKTAWRAARDMHRQCPARGERTPQRGSKERAMEENFAEQIVPGTFIRVQAEGLIAPKGVSFGNVGIVGTATAATGVSDAIGKTHILGSMEDAAKLYMPSDALSAGTQNLMR